MARLSSALARRAVSAALVLFCLSLACAARAERYALLVGISSYPSLPERLQLSGPKNDVEMWRRLLLQRGFAQGNVRILADQVQAAQGEPTYSAITGELKALATKVQRGDFVLLFFGGHGSQQPAKISPQNLEPDGLDEIFLPRDIGKWADAVGVVQNAIVDDQLGEAITAIRNRGAFVWAIFDTCHSGTITRGVQDPDVRYRDVPRDVLGISESAVIKAQKAAAALSTRGASENSAAPMTALQQTAKLEPGAGGFVAFYAAQSWELAPEAPMPANLSAGDPNKRPYGVFSYAVAEVLATNSTMTYRQAGEQILQRYRQHVRSQPTPLFEGPGLDAPVFGTTVGPRVLQWKIEKSEKGLRVPAGALHQFAEGAVFAVFANAGDPDRAALGFLQASKVDVLEAELVPIARDGKPQLDRAKIPGEAYARLVHPNVSLALRVSLPDTKAAAKDASVDRTLAVLTQLSREKVQGMAVTWVSAQQSGEIRLLIRDGHLWFLPATGEIVRSGSYKTISIDLANKTDEQLRDLIVSTLRSTARVANVLKLASMAGSTSVSQGVDVRVSYQRQGKSIDLRPNQVPQLRNGDKLQIVIHNKLKEAVDVNVIFVDSRYGIHHLAVERFEPAGRETIDIGTVDTTGTIGRESILAIISEARPGEPMTDFSFLNQPTVPVTRAAKNSSPLEQLFEAAAFQPELTRGLAEPARTLNTLAFRLFNWNTVAN